MAYHDNGRYHVQTCDFELLNRFEHLDKVKFLHHVGWNSAFGTAGYEDRLGHCVIHWEVA